MSCDARDLLSRLYAARRASLTYAPEHPAFYEAATGLAESTEACLREDIDVELGFHAGEVSFGGETLPDESMIFEQLARDLSSVGANSVIIRRGVVAEELRRALGVFSASEAAVSEAGGIGAVARAARLVDIEVSGHREPDRSAEEEPERREEAKTAYGEAVSLMRDLERIMRSDGTVPSARIEAVVRLLVEHTLADPDEMILLTGMKDSDEYTPYHSANVAILSIVLGSLLDTGRRFLRSLTLGALLHDVGMFAIDREVLARPGVLDPEEWNEVRRHPVLGAQMVSLVDGLDRAAVVTILEHHMRYDSSGYPARAADRGQHIMSRIVAVADAYDAMTSQRSYSAARVPDQAVAVLLQEAGSGLDPDLVRLFVGALGVYPPRSVVRLSTGETGIVVRATEDPLRPVVRIIASSEGELVEPSDLDLVAETAVSVEGCIDPRMVNIEADDYI